MEVENFKQLSALPSGWFYFRRLLARLLFNFSDKQKYLNSLKLDNLDPIELYTIFSKMHPEMEHDLLKHKRASSGIHIKRRLYWRYRKQIVDALCKWLEIESEVDRRPIRMALYKILGGNPNSR